jgi:hypothetical protein
VHSRLRELTPLKILFNDGEALISIEALPGQGSTAAAHVAKLERPAVREMSAWLTLDGLGGGHAHGH